MNFNKILIAGCSYASGYGLPEEHLDSNCWTNILSNKLKAKTVKNISKIGSNNQWIFLETMSELIKNDYDLVLVEWSAIPRYRFHVGLELYTIMSSLDRDINLVGNTTVTKKWLAEFKDRLLAIHNDHWDLLDLIKYVNVLIKIQAQSKHIFFINGLGPWTDQYFVKKSILLPSDLDSFTYKLLQAELRDDSEVFQLYNMIHEQYNFYGNIREDYWLNLYQSMDKIKVDTVSRTDPHPGINSQQVFADHFYQQIQQKIK